MQHQTSGQIATRNATTDGIQLCILRLNAGDTAARNELLTITQQRLEALARKQIHGRFVSLAGRTGSVLQDTVAKMIRRWDYVVGGNSKVGTLATPAQYFKRASFLMRDVLVDMLRKQRNESPLDPMQAGEQDDRHAFWIDFNQQVERLPDELREVVDLHVYQGMTHREAGEVLRVAEITARVRWAKARRRLAAALSEYNTQW